MSTFQILPVILTLCAGVILCCASNTVAGPPGIYKAVVQRDALYVKTRSGSIAVAELKNDAVKLLSLPNEVRDDVWDAWDVDGDRIAYTFARSEIQWPVKLCLIEIEKLPSIEEKRAAVHGRVGSNYVNIPGMVIFFSSPSVKIRPSSDHPSMSDFCFNEMHRVLSAGGFDEYVVVTEYEHAVKPLEVLNFTNQQAKDLSPFVVLPHPQGALLIEINGGREVEVTENAFKVAKPAAEDPQSKAADDAYAVAIVDKRGKFSVLRCSVARDGSKVVALATKDAPPATQPIETDKLTKALGRAVAALNKAGAFDKPAK